MGENKGGGNGLPDSINTEDAIRKYISTLDKDQCGKQQIKFTNDWLKKFDEFKALHLKAGGTYFQPPKTIATWLYSNRDRFLSGSLPEWKIDALEKIGFAAFCEVSPVYIKAPSPIETENQMRLHIGDKSISGNVTLVDRQNTEWLQKLAQFIEAWQTSGRNVDAIPKELSTWLTNNRIRYINASLPKWKMAALKDADFETYYLNTGRKIAKYVPLLRQYFKKHDSYAVRRTQGFTALYKWKSNFIQAAPRGEIRMLLSFFPGMTKKQKEDFFKQTEVDVFPPEEGFFELSEDSKQFLEEENSALEKRFTDKTAVQACGILRRLSMVEPLSNVEQDALGWLTHFCQLRDEINAQAVAIIDLELNKPDRVYLRSTRRRFLKGQLFNWQKKYLLDIAFETFATDPLSRSDREQNIDLLKQYKLAHGSILVDPRHKDYKKLFEWRQRINRLARKASSKEWAENYIDRYLKDEFPDVDIATWNEFFLTLPSTRRLRKQVNEKPST